MTPTIGFDVLLATFDDLMKECRGKDLPLLEYLQMYLQRFNALFFNEELKGSIFLAIWNEKVMNYDQMMIIRQQSVFQRKDLMLQDLKDMMIVYDPPMYFYCSSNPFKYMNKPILDRKLDLFRQGFVDLFHIEPKPIFYPF